MRIQYRMQFVFLYRRRPVNLLHTANKQHSEKIVSRKSNRIIYSLWANTKNILQINIGKSQTPETKIWQHINYLMCVCVCALLLFNFNVKIQWVALIFSIQFGVGPIKFWVQFASVDACVAVYGSCLYKA